MKKIIISAIAIAMIGVGGFAGIKFVTDNQYGTADLANGKVKFQANCLVCHGEKGLGDGIAGKQLAISPDNIFEELNNPLGMKMELIDSVLEGDNGEGGLMPAFKTTLSENDVNDIFEYINSING